jgi:hypothetical protein
MVLCNAFFSIRCCRFSFSIFAVIASMDSVAGEAEDQYNMLIWNVDATPINLLSQAVISFDREIGNFSASSPISAASFL